MSKENCCTTMFSQSDMEMCCSIENQKEALTVNNCDCACGPDNFEDKNEISSEKSEFDISIDGKKVRVEDPSMNIVDIAKSAGISIPAPCYFSKRKNGCCKVCVVEVNSQKKYACATKAKEGMDIVIDREDLKAIRKERLLKYKEAIKNNKPLQCS